jgi:HEAT repeat protein
MRKVFGVAMLIVALFVLLPSAPGADVSDQVARLKSKDTDERRRAAKELAEMGADARDAAPALIKALKDSDLFVRRFSAEALGKIGPKASGSVEALTAVVKNKSEKKEVLQAAVTALGQMGGAGVDALVGVLKDHDMDNVARRKAAEALGEIGKDAHSAVEALNATVQEKTAKGKNPKKGPPVAEDIRVEAITALGKIANAKDEETIKLLEEITTSKNRNKTLMDASRKALSAIKARQ